MCYSLLASIRQNNMQNSEYHNEDVPTGTEPTANIITRLLTGWGIPGGLARILAGAILGALSAIWALSQTGCAVEWSRGADGSASWHSRIQLPPPRVLTPNK